jgi:hypothetical protein
MAFRLTCATFEDALVRSLERDELLCALGSAIDGLLRAADGLPTWLRR